MNENKTVSMLQRIPVILAVTAASYGLPLQAQSSPTRTVSKHESRSAQIAPQPRLVQQR